MTVEDSLLALCQANDEAGRPHDTGMVELLKKAVNSGLDFYETVDLDSMRLAEIISAAELDPVVLRFALENGFDPEHKLEFYGQEYSAKDRLTACVMGDVWFGAMNEKRAEETYRMLLSLKPDVELVDDGRSVIDRVRDAGTDMEVDSPFHFLWYRRLRAYSRQENWQEIQPSEMAVGFEPTKVVFQGADREVDLNKGFRCSALSFVFPDSTKSKGLRTLTIGTANPDAHPVANEHLVWSPGDKGVELNFHPSEGLGRFQRVERVWDTYARLYFERVIVTVWVSPEGDKDRRFSLDWKMRIDWQQPTLRKRLRFIQRLFSRD